MDDFDRPLTESNVRLFAGAMLDVIKGEFQDSDDQDVGDTLFRLREELRYYADLGRFASICDALAEPLGLAFESDKRRIPSSSRVIILLCALAERTLSSPAIRAELESTVDNKENAQALKAEKQRWEKEKKELSAASLQAKGQDAKRISEEVSHVVESRLIQIRTKQKAHETATSTIEVEMRSAAGRHAPRYQPLLTDHQGRTYYTLSIRPIDRPPIGWASGLIVYGKGVSDEDIPAEQERWSHFGKSSDVKQLAKWLSYKGNDVGALAPVIEWLEVLEIHGMGELED